MVLVFIIEVHFLFGFVCIRIVVGIIGKRFVVIAVMVVARGVANVVRVALVGMVVIALTIVHGAFLVAC